MPRNLMKTIKTLSSTRDMRNTGLHLVLRIRPDGEDGVETTQRQMALLSLQPSSQGPTQTTALVARSTSSSAAVATEHSNETWQVSFPSGWKDIDYWYGPSISSQLSADKRRGLSATTFEAEQTKIIYYVDFGSLTQRNVTSGRIRKIRCIPSW